MPYAAELRALCRIVTEPLLQRTGRRPYCERNATERETPMSEKTHEQEQQHLLLIVEAAQRAGRSEPEINEIVAAAREADAELERAA
jgi:hypothetical protein